MVKVKKVMSPTEFLVVRIFSAIMLWGIGWFLTLFPFGIILDLISIIISFIILFTIPLGLSDPSKRTSFVLEGNCPSCGNKLTAQPEDKKITCDIGGTEYDETRGREISFRCGTKCSIIVD